MGPSARFIFGAHKGIRLDVVIRENPNYVVFHLKRKHIRLKPASMFLLYEALDKA